MTHRELDAKFTQAVMKAETILTDRDKSALAGMYHSMLFDKKHELNISMEEQMTKIAGVIEFLTGCGRILEDEELWMLMNEIEAEEAEA